jgi:hypothetical protein
VKIHHCDILYYNSLIITNKTDAIYNYSIQQDQKYSDDDEISRIVAPAIMPREEIPEKGL